IQRVREIVRRCCDGDFLVVLKIRKKRDRDAYLLRCVRFVESSNDASHRLILRLLSLMRPDANYLLLRLSRFAATTLGEDAEGQQPQQHRRRQNPAEEWLRLRIRDHGEERGTIEVKRFR